MKQLLLFAICMIFSSCASQPSSEAADPKREISEKDAVLRATAEVVKRKWGLPAGYETNASKDSKVQEMGPSAAIFTIKFYGRDGRKRVWLYQVFVNRESGKIEGAFNMLKTTPMIR